MSRLVIQRFEYEKLRIGEEGFEEPHFNRLVLYNERHGNQYFDVGYRSIRFKNYVGVIQAGNLTLEILPKADKRDTDKRKWQRALIDMLRICGHLKLSSLSESQLRIRSASLIDLFFESFLVEVERLAHEGLTKKYRQEEGNLLKVKGKILFSTHLRRNLIHRERFFTRHTVYDRDNTFNRILKKALLILRDITTSAGIYSRTAGLLLYFDGISDLQVDARTFQRLQYDRKTGAYRKAMGLAKLIILQYSPDLTAGRTDVLAILFDMNRLFEEYVYRILKRAEPDFADVGLSVKGQQRYRFWGNHHIVPDILLTIGKPPIERRLVIDTKWKIPINERPNDADLKQMYAYNIQLNSNRAVLLYPGSGVSYDRYQYFDSSLNPKIDFKHGCTICFLSLFDETVINYKIGNSIMIYLLDVIDRGRNLRRIEPK